MVRTTPLYFYGSYHVAEHVPLTCGLRDCSLTAVQVAYAIRLERDMDPPDLTPTTPLTLVPLCIYHFVRFRKLLEDAGQPV